MMRFLITLCFMGSTLAGVNTFHDLVVNYKSSDVDAVLPYFVPFKQELVSMLNDSDEQGDTPLHSAARHNNADMLDVLIRYGAFVNAPNCEGKTPLHIACEVYNPSPSTCYLHSEHDVYTKVHALIRHGAHVNALDNDGNTPVHYVAQNGYVYVLHELKNFGARFDAVNTMNQTPLHITCKNGNSPHDTIDNIAMVRALIGYAPHAVNARDIRYNTPLHFAIENVGYAIASELIEAQSDIFQENVSGVMPIDVLYQHLNTTNTLSTSEYDHILMLGDRVANIGAFAFDSRLWNAFLQMSLRMHRPEATQCALHAGADPDSGAKALKRVSYIGKNSNIKHRISLLLQWGMSRDLLSKVSRRFTANQNKRISEITNKLDILHLNKAIPQNLNAYNRYYLIQLAIGREFYGVLKHMLPML